ncbi:hypothetical protein BGZ61DRAFT_542196 [Ilyonectria robusta]|uniref:uncharacterized protein n=1 Tax=Ilyonectria robusta TaxID=1079257 RepID=UPI001E8D782B|nr:uncharacterized protein BGZ61DRAFT_542196 [Ilyonectria robusta]KAH8650445.1 hypothetical protein BGZ61DRAFT_542196 [Ilyonectria robusta]
MRDILKLALQRKHYALFERIAGLAIVVEDQLIAFRKGLTSAISSYRHFADQCRVIARETIQPCLDAYTSKTCGKADGLAMVDLALYFEDPVAFFSEAVAPVINKKIAASSLILGFLDLLRKQGADRILPTERTMQLHRAEAKSFNTLTDFAKIHSDVGVQLTSVKRAHPTTSNPSSWDEFRTLCGMYTHVLSYPCVKRKTVPSRSPKTST